jgi:hypothetical protein
VRTLTRQLKAPGALPVTEVERVAMELDRLHPDARHGDTVDHLGQRYRRRCTPARMSRAGNVMSWDCTWIAAEGHHKGARHSNVERLQIRIVFGSSTS